ncbi:DUF1735 domain-containing protein [Mucilaginibacter pallidiroseus]|uniref:DUF1735 domain-containing protein n=1 Tax=Mucilaginibacter pallidiroseus TaxID=2599295 RepID=A0A563UEK1_9SPHI|nr:DUF1735 domain-containing protein [Mucilaginibacter pallidiroseus]TWR29797.1 DUF1735 domain-containing protein [Mucilaginibacter pallidiroseus]
MKKVLGLSLMSVLMLSLASCLKDKTANIDPSGSPAVVGWSTSTTGDQPADVTAGFTRYSRSYNISTTETEMLVQVSYSGSSLPTSDVTVNLGLDLDALKAYNAAHSPQTSVVLPSTVYTMPSSVVIKAGQRKADIVVKLKTNLFDLQQAYILPLKITSTSAGAVSSNYGTVLYSVGAKNQYDGVYALKGYVVRQGDTGGLMGYTVKGIANRELITLGPNSVSFTQLWANGGGIAGIDGTTITVNPTTNKVTMSASSNPALKNLESYDNRYDPATKTFYISFYWGNGPAHRAATDTLTYIGPR